MCVCVCANECVKTCVGVRICVCAYLQHVSLPQLQLSGQSLQVPLHSRVESLCLGDLEVVVNNVTCGGSTTTKQMV